MRHLAAFFSLLLGLCILCGGTCDDKDDNPFSGPTSLPSAFNLRSPLDQTGTSLTPTLEWENPAGESSFRLEVAEDQNFQTTVYFLQLNQDVTQHTLPPGALQKSKWYYWRVYAQNALGQVLASNAPWSFITVGPNTAIGVLDTSFANTGIVSSDNPAGGNNGGNDEGAAVVQDSQGRIIVVGFSFNGNDTDMTVWRYNSDGTLDNTFNSGGQNPGVLLSGIQGDDQGVAVGVDNSDNIYIAGFVTVGGNKYFTLWKVDSTGQFVNLTQNGPYTWSDISEAFDIYVDTTQARVYVVGYIFIPNQGNFMTVWRFLLNGQLDTSFGQTQGGSQIGYFMLPTAGTMGNALRLDTNNRILVTGSGIVAGTTAFHVWRVKADGSDLDTTFNTTGTYQDTSADSAGRDIVLDSNGKIWACGYRQGGSYRKMCLWRLNADGTPDNTFDSGNNRNWRTYDLGGTDEEGLSMLIDLDGNIVVTGYTTTSNNGMDLAIWRILSSSGGLDPVFNSQGYVTHNNAANGNQGANQHDRGRGIDITSNGRLLVTGYSTNSTPDTDMVLWKWR